MLNFEHFPFIEKQGNLMTVDNSTFFIFIAPSFFSSQMSVKEKWDVNMVDQEKHCKLEQF